MTENKPIIIDDIDVNGCEHLYREIDCLAHIDFSECCEGYNPSYGYCPNIPNCYYKQLQREKQDSQEARDTAIKEFNRAEKLSQTLTDIRKIAEKEVKHAPDGETFSRPEIKQILQKINEVEINGTNP